MNTIKNSEPLSKTERAARELELALKGGDGFLHRAVTIFSRHIALEKAYIADKQKVGARYEAQTLPVLLSIGAMMAGGVCLLAGTLFAALPVAAAGGVAALAGLAGNYRNSRVAKKIENAEAALDSRFVAVAAAASCGIESMQDGLVSGPDSLRQQFNELRADYEAQRQPLPQPAPTRKPLFALDPETEKALREVSTNPVVVFTSVYGRRW